MENGRLIEDGTPYELVMNKQSAFYKMIAESKESTALIQAAMLSHWIYEIKWALKLKNPSYLKQLSNMSRS